MHSFSLDKGVNQQKCLFPFMQREFVMTIKLRFDVNHDSSMKNLITTLKALRPLFYERTYKGENLTG